MRFARHAVVLAALVALTHAADARATWPPPRGADLTSPSNWPNDPGYAELWNYFSFLPPQAAGAPSLLGADVALGASGMSVDRAWELTTGTPEVRIDVLDSGILWEEPDLLQQAWLNPYELSGEHAPRTATGAPCGGMGALAGYDCNGDGVFSVADYAADPRLTPAVPGDRCVDPGTGVPGGDRMAGDLNHNCVLDAGDLIELFSDGVDGDANGYTDDIAGWDFFKNDNNPYDDTRDGHGTGVALAAAAEGNNRVESVGVCPGCRVVMLRVGDSSVVDSNDVAKALTYAADAERDERQGATSPLGGVVGATVAVLAVDAVNLSAFAKAAIDYAYLQDVVVVASLGDDGSREHTVPATYSHTLTTHAVSFSGASPSTSASFLAGVNCANFGGQLLVSASASGCSDEAAARTAGVIGLIESAGIGMTPPMTAEEVMQLAKGTADVIDVPESRPASGGVAPGYYESLPGFSQRFGYGRVNAASAIEAVQAGDIPPQVEISSPAWFQTLYADRTSSPVPVYGRVVATRAPSYDVAVEWAPGVEPLDAEFLPLADTVTNIPGQSVSGGPSVPLAVIDPTAMDTAHTADPDSPHHENDRTITLRVRAIAHYAGGDVKGEARRTIAIVNQDNGLDQTLLPGFPLQLGGSVEGGIKLADIDGDGVRDIVFATNDGLLHALSAAAGSVPREVTGFPYALQPIDGLDATSPVPSVPSYLTAPAYTQGQSGGVTPGLALESVDGTPAIGDVLGTGDLEIVVVSWAGTVYVINSAGQDVPGWPQRLPLVPSCPDDPDVPAAAGDCMDASHAWSRGAYASPVLTDFDGDGALDIVVAAFDGNVYLFHGTGVPFAGFPVRIHAAAAARYDRVMSTPAVADFTGDAVPDILVGSNETVGLYGGTGFYFLVRGEGSGATAGPYAPSWPVLIPTTYDVPVTGIGTSASPVALALGTAGLDALLQGNASPPLIVPANPGPQSGSSAPGSQLPSPAGFAPLGQFGALTTAAPDVMLPMYSHPSVGDLDQDGTPDVVMSGGSQSLEDALSTTTGGGPFQQLLGMWSGKTGAMMPGAPVVLEDYTRMGSQAIADVTGDGYPEVIVGTGGYFVHAVDACGREPTGWPKFTGGWVMGTPAVGDITGDHALEIVAATREGFLYAWSTAGTDTGVIEWESFHHDNANTGSYATPLEQGPLAPTSQTPLVCGAAVADAGASTPSSPAGSRGSGCHCAVRPRREGTGAGAGAGLAVVALSLARRRRRPV